MSERWQATGAYGSWVMENLGEANFWCLGFKEYFLCKEQRQQTVAWVSLGEVLCHGFKATLCTPMTDCLA